MSRIGTVERRRVLKAARIVYDAGVIHKWFGPSYTKSYDEFAASDPIGFDEFNAIIENALAVADNTQ